jgi:hypothetical protein
MTPDEIKAAVDADSLPPGDDENDNRERSVIRVVPARSIPPEAYLPDADPIGSP